MWLLECDGDVFKGKRLWLRPGKRFLFGRTKSDVPGFAIPNKTVSRKHLLIEVGEVKPGDAVKLDCRSQLILEDLGTKIGTLVDGVQIRGKRHVLDGDQHEIKLGQFEDPFRIRWQPVVLSFSFTGKELRSDPISSLRQQLESLDIKLLIDYDRQNTTHVVAKKRNTSKGLQALINGTYIVDHSFVEAIVEAASGDPNMECALEQDFDLHWPNALDHLPPKGQEPTERPAGAYSPNPDRRDIFDGYTFVFYDQSQFDNLLAPITNGRGKALLYKLTPAETQADELIRYVKNVAGEKGLGEFEDGSEGKGVVVVRYQPKPGPLLEWFSEFGRQVSLRLDHRLIEQSEFLDAILNNDASVLRRPLDIEASESVVTAINIALSAPALPTFQANHDEPVAQEGLSSSIPAPASQPPKIGRSRRTVTSRFKGFDEDFDLPAMVESELANDNLPSQASGLFVSQDQTENEARNSKVPATEPRANKKHQLPLIDASEDEDILDQLAPNAARFKRRRLADELKTGRRSSNLQSSTAVNLGDSDVALKPKRIKKEIDILAVAREQREKEDAIAMADREALQEAMHGLDIEKIRNIAVIEGMEVKPREPSQRLEAYGGEGSRWNESWNGRKNFKKFRKRGEDNRSRPRKLIVLLEEVKKKDFGIGDDYWLRGDQDRQGRRTDRDRDNDTRERITSPSEPNMPNQSKGIAPETKAVSQTTRTSSRASSRPFRTGNATQPLPSQAKRQATESILKPGPPKKSRQLLRSQDSDDSDEGFGFKFKKKK